MQPLTTIVPRTGSRFVRVDRVIVGAGPAGTRILANSQLLPLRQQNKPYDIQQLITGQVGGLWTAMAAMNPRLPMGQSGVFFETERDRIGKHHREPFMQAGRFVKEEESAMKRLLKEQQTILAPVHVTSIRKYDTNEFFLTMQDGTSFIANEVVISSGPGRPSSLDQITDVRKRPEAPRREFPEELDATSFLSGARIPKAGAIAVYGGGPSAAWVIAYLLRRDQEVAWIADPERGGFSGADPGGRNSLTLLQARGLGLLRLGLLQGAEYETPRDLSDPRKPGLALNLKDLHTLDESSGRDTTLPVSQIVVATGSNRSTALEFLDPVLVEELVPIYSSILSTAPEIAIGLTTEDRDCIVTGSTGTSLLNLRGLGDSIRALADTLPAMARPPEGIAMIGAQTELLTGRMLSRPNFRVANKDQIADYISKRLPSIGESGWKEMSEAIITERSRSDSTDESLGSMIKEHLGEEL